MAFQQSEFMVGKPTGGRTQAGTPAGRRGTQSVCNTKPPHCSSPCKWSKSKPAKSASTKKLPPIMTTRNPFWPAAPLCCVMALSACASNPTAHSVQPVICPTFPSLPEVTLDQMITEMVAADLGEAKKHALIKKHG